MSLQGEEKRGYIELTHLIDIGLWQFMLDRLSEQLEAGIRIVSEGNKVVLQSGVAALCREAMKRQAKHPACFRCCDIQDFGRYDQGGFALCKYCDDAINFVFNLRIDGIQGHVIIGPVWIAEKGRRATRGRLARKFGVGQAKFAELSGQLKAYSLEEFRKAGEMVSSTMRVIAQTLGASLDLINQVDRLKEALLREKKKTWRQMVKDRATGVYRHNYGLARLREEMARAESYSGDRRSPDYHSVSIVVIGIEQFRSYVDRHGPAAANAFLRNVGALVQEGCRRTDLPVRLREEEFLLILPFTAEEGARTVLDRLRGELRAFSFSDETGATVESPLMVEGLASYPKDGQNGGELLRRALDRISAQ